MKLDLIHTMSRANRKNPPSLEEGGGLVEIQTKAGFTVTQTLSKTDCSQSCGVYCDWTGPSLLTLKLRRQEKENEKGRKKILLKEKD